MAEADFGLVQDDGTWQMLSQPSHCDASYVIDRHCEYLQFPYQAEETLITSRHKYPTAVYVHCPKVQVLTSHLLQQPTNNLFGVLEKLPSYGYQMRQILSTRYQVVTRILTGSWNYAASSVCFSLSSSRSAGHFGAWFPFCFLYNPLFLIFTFLHSR